jgi:tRNA nucleotidyltransferase (CCA-adding enzyme)
MSPIHFLGANLPIQDYNRFMDVILTHEQADFDALGSLLAAALLENSKRSQPVIAIAPRRSNRNGRAFLALYRTELPFTDPIDLPNEPVNHILLVDTQSMITLKGAGAHTKIRVIDHHPLRSDLSPDWSIASEPTGACTTLLVEELQNKSLPFSNIQSTLMLLGIYEDTGSLSYHHTTPRDLRAAAYLLEQGASLQILAEYLNPPLSSEQQQIYDHLLQNVEIKTIHGQKIVLSKTDAREMTDEISSIAHKMRDLLEPDALFLLVKTDEGIRLVTRSTSDQINVAALASQFGGGGHERAAAALIKPQNLSASDSSGDFLSLVYQQLLDLLPQFIRPAITVSQIMSRHPHLITPQTSAQEALQLMQRYGYEGFPVVQEGKINGLLTRRAVDRANSHKLNLTAASLMESGQYWVSPGDSLEHLQEVMVSSGWGQIPVVDPESGKVIGIVTRTDLLKILTSHSGSPTKKNLSAKLESALPPARLQLLKDIANKASTLRIPLYIVGGFVRDLLLDRPNLDFDLVVEGDAISLGKALGAQYGGRVVFHSRFGTAKWQPPDLSETIDLISARTEFYERPTALPTVETGNIKMDLHRRDFTINTLALRLDGKHYGELLNHWGGLNDLEQGVVRVLHSLSFVDDPTRLLRAVRFEQRFDFRIEIRTIQLMEEARPLLKQVSGDRLRHELNLILVEEKAAAMLSRLENLGILTAIQSDIPWNEEIAGQIPAGLTQEIRGEWGLPSDPDPETVCELAYLVWLAYLPEESIRPVAERLKFSNSLTKSLVATSALLEDLATLENATPSQIVERLDTLPATAIYAAYRLTKVIPYRQILQTYAQKWRYITSINNGKSLKEKGLPPSPAYRSILTGLRNAWLDGLIHDEDEEEALLGKLLDGNESLA